MLRTLLTYPELDGYLAEGTPFYTRYRFQPLATSAEILGRFDGERREFLERLFRQARKARTWFDIDLQDASQATGAPRERMVRALDYLQEQGLLEVRVEGVRQRFRRLAMPPDMADLVQRLAQRLGARRAAPAGAFSLWSDVAKTQPGAAEPPSLVWRPQSRLLSSGVTAGRGVR